jgi:predicted GNAT superfamily acetyltransferase
VEKLGCVIREYAVNLYPTSGSRFNEGLESDRFTAEWWIASRRVKDSLAGRKRAYDLSEYAPAIATRATEAGWREPVDGAVRVRGKRISIEIPDDIDALKTDDLALAQRWREATRRAFVAALRKGYVVHGFAGVPEVGRRRSFYLLEKGYRVR